MSFFSGKNLTRKIQDYSLADLDEVLEGFIENQNWPGLLMIPVDNPDLLERVRTVLYSMLHKHGLKEAFTVRVIPAKKMLTVDLKTSVGKTGGVYRQSAASYKPEASETPTASADDVLSIFEDASKSTKNS